MTKPRLFQRRDRRPPSLGDALGGNRGQTKGRMGLVKTCNQNSIDIIARNSHVRIDRHVACAMVVNDSLYPIPGRVTDDVKSCAAYTLRDNPA